jgi:hypothetical protein
MLSNVNTCSFFYARYSVASSAVLAKVSLNTATVCAYNLTSEEPQQRQGKYTYVTSTDQDERTSPLSSNLSEQNLLSGNTVIFECLQDLY